ncbi:MAG: hypothetical protein N3A38_14240, partial [Planctomycetota bacterium]|nr:hypothetical protein [Planctomycetota bacterium]
MIEARDDGPHAKYYGLEIRTSSEEASVWVRTGGAGAYSYTPLGETAQPLPVDFAQTGEQPEVHPALTYVGVPSLAPGRPFVPWGKRRLQGRGIAIQYAVCLTVERKDLNPPGAVNPTLVVAKKGDDPRAPKDAFAPLIEVPLDLSAIRDPGKSGDARIVRHVKSFSNFVFVIGE